MCVFPYSASGKELTEVGDHPAISFSFASRTLPSTVVFAALVVGLGDSTSEASRRVQVHYR